MVNRAFVNVGRWSALAFGLVYGYTHNASLQKQSHEHRKEAEYKRKEELIQQAKAAYAKKTRPAGDQAESLESVDVDSPNFDLEKFLTQLEKN